MSDEFEDDEYVEVTAHIEFDPDMPWDEPCPVCGGELFFHDVEAENVLVLDCRTCNAIVRFTPTTSAPLPLGALVDIDEHDGYQFN